MRHWLALLATAIFATVSISAAVSGSAEARECRLRAHKGGRACLIWGPADTTTTTEPTTTVAG